MFIPAYIFKTDRLTDISYSLTFISLIMLAWVLEPYSIENTLLFVMIAAWALRLGLFLLIRINKMKRDKRFDGRRESFIKFLSFWLLQGSAVGIVLIPALLFMAKNDGAISPAGIAVWLIGFLVETISDIQKYRFNIDPANKGKFIDSGLWKYSRHPNYFGEILVWFGLYIYVCPGLNGIEKLFALIGPLFITTLLLFVSGIPTVEKRAQEKFGKDPAWLDYKRRTNMIIPWFPRKSTPASRL